MYPQKSDTTAALAITYTFTQQYTDLLATFIQTSDNHSTVSTERQSACSCPNYAVNRKKLPVKTWCMMFVSLLWGRGSSYGKSLEMGPLLPSWLLTSTQSQLHRDMDEFCVEELNWSWIPPLTWYNIFGMNKSIDYQPSLRTLLVYPISAFLFVKLSFTENHQKVCHLKKNTISLSKLYKEEACEYFFQIQFPASVADSGVLAVWRPKANKDVKPSPALVLNLFQYWLWKKVLHLTFPNGPFIK